MFIIVDRSVAIYEFTVYFKLKHCAMNSFEKVVTEVSLEENMYRCSCPIYGRRGDCSRRSGAIRLCSHTQHVLSHLGLRTRTVDAYFCIRLSVCILLVRPFQDSKMTTSRRKLSKNL